MTALYIILGIIAFIILLLSIKVMITVHYDEELTVSLSWLFLKFDLLPMKEKHPKKEKKKKEKEPKKTDASGYVYVDCSFNIFSQSLSCLNTLKI